MSTGGIEIFSASMINGSLTERYSNMVLLYSKTKKSHSISKNDYVDTSKLKQNQFLMKNLRKLSDFRKYESIPRTPNKTSRLKYCLKPETKIIKKSQKNYNNFKFMQSNKPDFKKFCLTSGPFTPKTAKNDKRLRTGLISLLRQSAKATSPSKSPEKIEIFLSKRKNSIK